MKIRALVLALAMLLGSIVTAQAESQCSCSAKEAKCVPAVGFICQHEPRRTVSVITECTFIPKGPRQPNPDCRPTYMSPPPHSGIITNNAPCEIVADPNDCGVVTHSVVVDTRCMVNKARTGCDIKRTKYVYNCSKKSEPNGGADGVRVDSRACAACKESGKCETVKCKVTTEVAANQCKPGSTVEESCVWSNAPTPAPSTTPGAAATPPAGR